MPGTIYPSNQPGKRDMFLRRFTLDVDQTSRMEARLAELNTEHDSEVKRLGALLTSARRKLFGSREP